MVVESRPYLPNPSERWFIFWKRRRDPAHPGLTLQDSTFCHPDELIEIQYDAYEIVELP